MLNNIRRFAVKYFRSVFVLVLIFILSTISGDKVEEVSIFKFEGMDKIVHLLMYMCFSLVVAYEIVLNNEGFSLAKIISIMVFVASVYGATLELVQNYFTESRSGDWYDFLFDLAGVLLAIPFLIIYLRRIRNRNNLLIR